MPTCVAAKAGGSHDCSSRLTNYSIQKGRNDKARRVAGECAVCFDEAGGSQKDLVTLRSQWGQVSRRRRSTQAAMGFLRLIKLRSFSAKQSILFHQFNDKHTYGL